MLIPTVRQQTATRSPPHVTYSMPGDNYYVHTVCLYKQEVSHTSRLYNNGKILHFNIQCHHRLGGDGNDLSH